jgi:autotransporter-associated beta strand protein
LGNNVLNPTASALGNPQAARNLNVNNGGTLTLTGPDTFGSAISTIVSTLVINSNGVVNNAGNNFNTFGPLQLNGGTLTGTGGAISGYQMYNLRGTVTVGGTSASTISGSGANAGYHLAAPTTFDVADIATGSDLNVSGRFVNQDDTHGGVGSLTKIGVGTMTLSGSNSYAGLTVISNGTLALSGSGSIGGSSSIEVGSGATLDVSAGSFTLGGSQTLKGNGSVVGAANINGALTPGASIGTLTFSVAPTLAGSIVAEINSAASPNADKVVVSSGTLNFGGTLTVTNLGSAPASGTTFDLFDGSLSGSFTTLILPPGGTLHWLTGNLNVDGTITFTNNTPTISNATVNRGSGVTAKVKKSDLAASDLDGDTLTYMLSTSTNGATITQNADYLFIPANTVNDAFTVTVSDGAGGSASATVTVNVVTTTGQTSGNVTLVAGNANLTFYGVPGTTYTVQRSTDLSTWTDLTTVTADSNGLVSYVDVGAPTPNAYYRLKF